MSNLKSFNIYDTPVLRSVDLTRALERFAGLLAGDVGARGISLSVDVAEDARWVQVDARCLHQVLLNLVTNSVDALAGRPAPRISLTADVLGEEVAIAVTDNGVGIASEDLAQLFRPFRTTKAKGTGLGMVIVKKMLNAMGAGLHVSSAVDEGTVVTITVPRASEGGAPRGGGAPRSGP